LIWEGHFGQFNPQAPGNAQIKKTGMAGIHPEKAQ